MQSSNQAALVLVERAEAATVILTLNRGDKRNALSIALMESLCEQLERLEHDRSCRSIIVQGAGPAFCAGLDLREAADPSVAERSALWVARSLRSIHTSSRVTIAAVHGAALAGGAGLMAACDFVLATPNTQFGFPEVRRGLVPALVTTVLRDRVRSNDLREFFLLAESFDGQRARESGLVDRLVPDDLLGAALEIARRVEQGAPQAVRDTKWLLRQAQRQRGEELLRTALDVHSQARTSAEAREGLAAFAARRTPTWPT